MTTNEMVDIAKANVDKTVKFTYHSGDIDLAVVITVDDEGFVYRLTGEGDTMFWTPFSEISRIEPITNTLKGST